MKNHVLLLTLTALCTFPCLSYSEENALTFADLRNRSVQGEKFKSLQSATLSYEIGGTDVETSDLIIRVMRGDKVRFDLTSGKDSSTACRNGDDFWYRQGTEEAHDMTREDAAVMLRDIAFLPIPFYSRSVYSNPVQVADQNVGDVPCSVYETEALDGVTLKLRMYLNKDTKLLQKIESESEEGFMTYVFRDFKDFDGIQLATQIYCASPDGIYTMKLHAANWNVTFPEELFSRDYKTNLSKVTAMSSVSSMPVRKTKVAVNPKDIEALEDQIAKEKIEIDAVKQRMDNLAAVYQEDKAKSVQLASVQRAPRAYGWGCMSGWRGENRDAHKRKRVAKALGREAEAAAVEYQKLSKKLTAMQIQLSEDEAALRRMKSK